MRDREGHTRARRIDELPGVTQFVEEGATLGDLWMEGYFRAGDPLTNQGAPPPPFGDDG